MEDEPLYQTVTFANDIELIVQRYNAFLVLNRNFTASCIVNGRKCTDWCIFWSTSPRVASYMSVNNSGPIAMYEPYKGNDISCNKLIF